MHLDIGEEIVVEAVAGAPGHRHGEVIEVIGEGAGRHYLVRWSDGHESLFFPEPDSSSVQPF